MKIKFIILDESLRKGIGEKEIVFELPNGSTVKDLLKRVEERYSKVLKNMLRPEVAVMLNGQNIEFLGGMDAKLKDGDRVAIVPIVAGG